MHKMTAVILSAGKGTRMKSKLPKALHPICGKPMTQYVIDACRSSGINNCIVVIGYGAEQVREALGDGVGYALQPEQLGTGDACRRAISLLSDDEGDVLVLPGDAPLISPKELSRMAAEHAASGAAATMLTATLDDAGHYGRVVRAEDGSVARIVEAKDASDKEQRIREINTGIYCFSLPILRKCLERITPANAQGEYYLTDVIGLMADDGLQVAAVESGDPNTVLGVNHRVDLAHLTGIIRRQILDRLMLGGVTIIDPSSTYVDHDVQVGPDTIIYPQTTLEKGCSIGEDCTIGPSSRLTNACIGNEVSVLFSNIADSTIGDCTRIGPFANIRPGCQIGKKVKIGDFVEAKNAEIGDAVSMSHLSYVGDAIVGEHTNIGAGSITCNYDGFGKHRTVIGKNAFVGSNVTMVAPVEIGDGALIAAGSVITEAVPPDSLAIARCKQTVKEDWARKRRERLSQGG
jgi:bifunctional UDP-N-acetylglucosamine pyrophosphorylase / glucosamine-1-phosphate N-acetyltransferase